MLAYTDATANDPEFDDVRRTGVCVYRGAKSAEGGGDCAPVFNRDGS